MKVYAVSVLLGGPDKEIEGLFSTRENAEAYAEELKKDGPYDSMIEEWDLDGLCCHRVRPVFACCVNVDGEIEHEWSYDLLVGEDEPDTTDQFSDCFIGRTIKSPDRARELARGALQAFLNRSADLAQKENGPN